MQGLVLAQDTCSVLGISSENDSGIVQIAAAGSRRPLLLRGHYCASSNPTNYK